MPFPGFETPKNRFQIFLLLLQKMKKAATLFRCYHFFGWKQESQEIGKLCVNQGCQIFLGAKY
jgi:hypothetical protein